MKKILFLLLIFATILTACKKNTNLDLDENAKKVLVEYSDFLSVKNFNIDEKDTLTLFDANYVKVDSDKFHDEKTFLNYLDGLLTTDFKKFYLDNYKDMIFTFKDNKVYMSKQYLENVSDTKIYYDEVKILNFGKNYLVETKMNSHSKDFNKLMAILADGKSYKIDDSISKYSFVDEKILSKIKTDDTEFLLSIKNKNYPYQLVEKLKYKGTKLDILKYYNYNQKDNSITELELDNNLIKNNIFDKFSAKDSKYIIFSLTKKDLENMKFDMKNYKENVFYYMFIPKYINDTNMYLIGDKYILPKSLSFYEIIENDRELKNVEKIRNIDML